MGGAVKTMQDYLHLRAEVDARRALAEGGLTPARIGALAGAAGGPKWLILAALDRYLFGEWLPRASQPVHLLGASIGAWRFAAACHRSDPPRAIASLEAAYMDQRYSDRADRAEITATTRRMLDRFFTDEVRIGALSHPRYCLHVITVRSRRLTASERHGALATGAALLDCLPDGRVPDHKDFYRYAGDDSGRRRAWQRAIDAGKRLRDAFAVFAESDDPLRYVEPL